MSFCIKNSSSKINQEYNTIQDETTFQQTNSDINSNNSDTNSEKNNNLDINSKQTNNLDINSEKTNNSDINSKQTNKETKKSFKLDLEPIKLKNYSTKFKSSGSLDVEDYFPSENINSKKEQNESDNSSSIEEDIVIDKKTGKWKLIKKPLNF